MKTTTSTNQVSGNNLRTLIDNLTVLLLVFADDIQFMDKVGHSLCRHEKCLPLKTSNEIQIPKCQRFDNDCTAWSEFKFPGIKKIWCLHVGKCYKKRESPLIDDAITDARMLVDHDDAEDWIDSRELQEADYNRVLLSCDGFFLLEGKIGPNKTLLNTISIMEIRDLRAQKFRDLDELDKEQNEDDSEERIFDEDSEDEESEDQDILYVTKEFLELQILLIFYLSIYFKSATIGANYPGHYSNMEFVSFHADYYFDREEMQDHDKFIWKYIGFDHDSEILTLSLPVAECTLLMKNSVKGLYDIDDSPPSNILTRNDFVSFLMKDFELNQSQFNSFVTWCGAMTIEGELVFVLH